METKTQKLAKPFSKGEKIVTTRTLGAIPKGTSGKIRLANGLGTWRRYWVKFSATEIVGQIDHNDLVRPSQAKLWEENQAAILLAAEKSSQEAAVEVAEKPAKTGSVSSQIPADLLERSKAAKQRLLG